VAKTLKVIETDAQGATTTRTDTYRDSCWGCGGSGRVPCGACSSSGTVTCDACAGHRSLLHYEELHIRWITRTSSEQVESAALPDELLGAAQGAVILQEEEGRIEQSQGAGCGGPYRGAAVRVSPEVETVANRLIADHTLAAGDKVRRQRLVVRAIPVYEARYRFGREERMFWIYGAERNVHAPRYPVSPLRVGAAIGAAAFTAAGIAFAIIAAAVT
jgi:hypothetical protein